ncbi:Calponin domain [Trinorchestia longiramus]|nr:Calponin domain [Trinorchestia longiramus]
MLLPATVLVLCGATGGTALVRALGGLDGMTKLGNPASQLLRYLHSTVVHQIWRSNSRLLHREQEINLSISSPPPAAPSVGVVPPLPLWPSSRSILCVCVRDLPLLLALSDVNATSKFRQCISIRISFFMDRYPDEQERVQKKTFLNWINAHLARRTPPLRISDLIEDLKDGTRLLALLEVLSGERLATEKGRVLRRPHFLANANTALQFLQSRRVRAPCFLL